MDERCRPKTTLKNIGDIAFYIALTVEIVIVILDKSAYIIQYEGQWFRLTFLLFLIKLCLTKYSKKEWMWIFVFGLFGAVSYFVCGKNDILRLVVMVAACKDLNFKFLFKYIFYMTLLGCIVLILLSFGGIGVLKITTEFRDNETETRYCFGMGHPNAMHCMVWALTTLFLLAYKDMIKVPHLIVLFIINCTLYVFTGSRTAGIVNGLTILLAAVLIYAGKLKTWKGIYIATGCGIAFLMAFSAILMQWETYLKYFQGINSIVNGRIIYTYYDIEEAEVQNWLPFSAKGYYKQTDLGYVKMAYWYGYIPYIVYFIVCILFLFAIKREEDYMALVMIISISIYTMFEGHDVSVYLGRNYLFFLFGQYWPQMFKTTDIDNRFFWQILKKTS